MAGNTNSLSSVPVPWLLMGPTSFTAPAPRLTPCLAVVGITNTAIKSVLAQVLSLLGDNSLMEQLIAEAQLSLASTNPADRRKALVDLTEPVS